MPHYLPPAISEYALLGANGQLALISRHGSVDWLCLPQVDSPSIFAAVLGDERHGRWFLGPHNPKDWHCHREYHYDGRQLTSVYSTAVAEFSRTDTLNIEHGTVIFDREIRGIRGQADINHELIIGVEYGRSAVEYNSPSISTHQCHGVDLSIDSPDIPPTIRQGDIFRVRLTWPYVLAHPAYALQTHSLEESNEILRAASRSAQVLRQLCHPSGAIIAAPTTSLPERPGGSRNWDYRYAWLRDSAFSIQALARAYSLGVSPNPISYIDRWRQWVALVVHDYKIMYRADGSTDLLEQELPHLPGYRSSLPVRIGNGASEQFQADVAGEVLIACQELRDRGYPDTYESWQAQLIITDAMIERIADKDRGIWEMRGDLHHFTHSRAMIYGGLRAMLHQAHSHKVDTQTRSLWHHTAMDIRQEIFQNGIEPEGQYFCQTYDSPHVDAALLQLPYSGLISWADPLLARTVERITETLASPSGLIYRYATESGIDGVEGGEFPFLICNFWLVEYYARTGEMSQAHKLFSSLLQAANDVGLLAEEYDAHNHRLWGNFPQGFSHVGAIGAAGALLDPISKKRTVFSVAQA
ncbi:glycoside hydrolase family 15 protein [Corynebacterium sp. ES2794-CONJ1]|uniref:glycoside hydrolase family 15 protein n=1 Tax=unclassified Corynebacterium TaxID=2624378 RepID=UPI00216B3A1D|nr:MULTISPECIES: glycoside hydrolase family 15 protein [unclassified Corynebacterium]MCS4532238.1 glycoside hydrolase family 15 protein [Corynebacterium sp. ES2730-CONJ]MCU9519797.1 glycoside hydrolase family 15 protein [Corynebacterium sp. ES2794-CONJ1]